MGEGEKDREHTNSESKTKKMMDTGSNVRAQGKGDERRDGRTEDEEVRRGLREEEGCALKGPRRRPCSSFVGWVPGRDGQRGRGVEVGGGDVGRLMVG